MVNKVYVDNVVFDGINHHVITTSKKQRALDSFKRIHAIEIKSNEQAVKIKEAAEQIFAGYSKKRASPVARLQRKIVQLFFHFLKKQSPEEKRFQAINLLYHQIIEDCKNYKGREDSTSAEDPAAVESVQPEDPSNVESVHPESVSDDEGVHSDEEAPPIPIIPKSIPPKLEPLDMTTIQDNFGVMGGEHILTKLKKAYLQKPSKELQRLRENGVLSKEVEDKLDVMCRSFNASKIEEIKVVYGRALEIQKHVGETHFVLLHAQAARWTLLAYLIKELVRHKYPKKEIEHFKFLRNPEALEKELIEFTGAEGLDDHNPIVRRDLLSCDGYLFNNSSGESALYFFRQNRSILSFSDAKVDEILEGLIPGKVALKKELKEFLQEQMRHSSVHRSLGTMHMILVPKEAIQNDRMGYVYRSHPFGKRCDCDALPGVDENTLIELMQHGVFQEEWKCRGTNIPQYRFLTSHLKPEKGIFFHTETSIPKADRKRIKAGLRTVINKHLESLP